MKAYIRHENSSIDLHADSASPIYPIRSGEQYYSTMTAKPNVVTTSRMFGTCEDSWSIQNIRNAKRTSIYNFWDSTLDEGYNGCTLIDQRNRMLFNALWPDWGETWKGIRGGVYDISINFTAPIPWTPPCIGAYTFIYNNANSHNLNADVDCTLDGGTLITGVGRSNGFTLSSGSGTDGVDSTISYPKQVEGHTYSLFGQIYTSGACEVIRLEQIYTPTGGVVLGIDSSLQPFIWVSDDASGSTLATCGAIDSNTWYDVCATYDQSTGSSFVFAWPSNNGEDFTHYLADATTLADHFTSNTVTSKNMQNKSFNRLALLRNSGGTISRLMNAFAFEGCIGSMGFNTLRRACHYWNEQTEVYPK